VACAPDRSVPAVRPTDVLVARQSVLDARLNVAGYELLFRTAGATRAHVTEHERATSQVIVDAIGEIGLDRLVGGQRAYVNVSRDLLLSQSVRCPCPPTGSSSSCSKASASTPN
jgi:c-di-GMP-related signal transduction protein